MTVLSFADAADAEAASTITQCRMCGAAPIGPDGRFCSMLCARAADEEIVDGGAGPVPEDLADADAGALDLRQGPAAYGEVDEAPGERLDSTPARECDDCGRQLSQAYARTFAQEDGTLYGPECRSRTQRYSNDPVRSYDDDE